MKNVTVSVPDEVYRTARIRAAEAGKSLSALVAEFLTGLSAREAEFARLAAKQQQIQCEIRQFRASDRMSRDDVHDRAVH